jgi:hypothetical protein
MISATGMAEILGGASALRPQVRIRARIYACHKNGFIESPLGAVFRPGLMNGL